MAQFASAYLIAFLGKPRVNRFQTPIDQPVDRDLSTGWFEPTLSHKHLSSLLLQLNSSHGFTRISHCEAKSRLLGRLYRLKDDEKKKSLDLPLQTAGLETSAVAGVRPQSWAFLISCQALPLCVSTGGLVAVRKQRDEKPSTLAPGFTWTKTTLLFPSQCICRFERLQHSSHSPSRQPGANYLDRYASCYICEGCCSMKSQRNMFVATAYLCTYAYFKLARY
jgi:hypothetical protein